jgi:hypothetical protein
MDFDKCLDEQRKQTEECSEFQSAIEDAIEIQYNSAIERYGAKYASSHEFYAVLYEEIIEATEEMQEITNKANMLFNKLRKNENIKHVAENIADSAYRAIEELTQVIAVINKYVGSK